MPFLILPSNQYHSLHLKLTYKADPTNNPPKQIQWAPSAVTGTPPKSFYVPMDGYSPLYQSFYVPMDGTNALKVIPQKGPNLHMRAFITVAVGP